MGYRIGARRGRGALRRACAAVVMACALAASMAPAQAFAYFNRGSVQVALGVQQVEVQAGATSSVTLSITPASDDQTEGCGMPKCPQGCSESCVDENGQCRCAGKDYETYYPSAVATSSNASVAVATCDGTSVTVYGKQEGEATITVRASLRQFTDAEATLVVKVSGTADGAAAGTAAFVDVPDAASAGEQEDKASVVEKTVMNRPVHMVRIDEACDAQAQLARLAGVDGDVTFWAGDTYYHPEYSLTFKGDAYAADGLFAFDPSLTVSTEASGVLNQPLAGLDGFVGVDFAHKGALPAAATVYVLAEDVFSDGQDVALYSYDAQAKSFAREDAQAQVTGGYAAFTVQEGKTYVVSSRDLTAEARTVVVGGQGQAQGDSCCDDTASTASGGSQQAIGSSLPPFVPIAVAVVAAGAAGAGIAVFAMGRKKKTAEGAGPASASSDRSGDPDAADAPAAPADQDGTRTHDGEGR